MPDTFDTRMKEYAAMVDHALLTYLKDDSSRQKVVFDAMRYSVSAGGKRIRPVLVLEFCRICGGNPENALPLACAVEYVHTYSLIHDDLPCMDDDDLRRGKPSCHKVFGYANALLAGDALLSLAFETALCNNSIEKLGAQSAAKAAGMLARASGAEGMVGGQIIDLSSEGQAVGIDILTDMHRKKTGAMIEAAAMMGCAAAGAGDAAIESARKYAACIGLAFQIVDDLLDVDGETEKLGKPIGSDSVNRKTTYVTLLGAEKSREFVGQLTDDALEHLRVFQDTGFLCELANRLSKRDR